MNVLFVVAEAFPFVKAGGLGEIAGSLPKYLNGTGKSKVRVIMPKYGIIPEYFFSQMKQAVSFELELGWRKISCRIAEMKLDGVHYYFVDNDYYFNRNSVYGFYDDGERFAFFCKAVLEGIPYLDFQPDILHCNDWHTALIPFLVKENYRNNPYYYPMKSLLTIHNLKHQGQFPLNYFEDVLGYGSEDISAWERLEYHNCLNYLKAGILSADRISTVSPTYALEIQQPYYGENLDKILRQRGSDLTGILNGIDVQTYNPDCDPLIFVNYSSSFTKKTRNKCKLQEHVNLPVNQDVPVLGIVSRLVEQKGFDLLPPIAEELFSLDLQLVVLGTGEPRYEEMFLQMAEQYPDKVASKICFYEDFAHKVYCGSDLILMPSRFEPCGLTQMMAMSYGTLPIVRETGGLKDTIVPYNEYTGEGNGFSFANYSAQELLLTVEKAVKLYSERKDIWRQLVKNALKSDFSWEKSAVNYLDLYRSLISF